MRLVAIIAALAWAIVSMPGASLAQPGKVPRVGYLLPASAEPRNEPFWDGLRKLGYVEGQNIVVERRYSEGRPDQLPQLAGELVRLNVDVIVADGTAATEAARQATATTPIVMIAANPVTQGIITSLRRPGGNVTGLSTNSPTLMGKRFELLKEARPRLSRVAVLWNVVNPGSASFLAEAESAARVLGLQVHSVGVRDASEIESAFAVMLGKRAEAVLVIEDPTVISRHIMRIAELAATHRLPTMAGSNFYPKAGLLMSYGPLYQVIFQRTAFYVDKILKGAKPAELPVEEPTVFELIINLKTAKALGLTIPQSLLIRADQVIQ